MKKLLNTMMALILVLVVCILAVSGCALPGRNNRIQNPGQNVPGGTSQDLNMPDGTTPGRTAPQNEQWGLLGGTQGDNRGGLLGVNPGATNQNARFQMPPAVDGQRAERIKKQLQGINEIDQVNVVVNGNRALVGYALKKTAANAADVRRAVERRILEFDQAVTRVTATNVPDMAREIGQLSRDVTSNKLGTEISAKFNQLVQRIGDQGR